MIYSLFRFRFLLMLKFLLLLIIPFTVLAQESNNDLEFIDAENEILIEENTFHEYVSLNENKVYDIEIIVFAYQQALPNYKTYTNKTLFEDSNALELQPKPEDLNFIQTKDDLLKTLDESENPITDTPTVQESEFTVSIADEEEDKQVLAWFQHEPESYKLTSIWDRLIKQENIVPLIHQSWRQVETPFDNPTYVKLNNLPVEEIDDNEGLTNFDNSNNIVENNQNNPFENSTNYNTVNFDDGNAIQAGPYGEFPTQEEILENKINAYSDFTVTGMVALSQGRFMHFGHNLNLIRHYANDNNEMRNMVFSLTERKQLKTDELHYFDSPWIGSIVKITEYLGEEQNDENDNGEINE